MSIIELAKQAGWSGIYTQWREPDGSPDWTPVNERLPVPVTAEQIEHFAHLVRAAALEEAAGIAEEELANSNALAAYNSVQRIRALKEKT